MRRSKERRHERKIFWREFRERRAASEAMKLMGKNEE